MFSMVQLERLFFLHFCWWAFNMMRGWLDPWRRHVFFLFFDLVNNNFLAYHLWWNCVTDLNWLFLHLLFNQFKRLEGIIFLTALFAKQILEVFWHVHTTLWHGCSNHFGHRLSYLISNYVLRYLNCRLCAAKGCRQVGIVIFKEAIAQLDLCFLRFLLSIGLWLLFFSVMIDSWLLYLLLLFLFFILLKDFWSFILNISFILEHAWLYYLCYLSLCTNLCNIEIWFNLLAGFLNIIVKLKAWNLGHDHARNLTNDLCCIYKGSVVTIIIPLYYGSIHRVFLVSRFTLNFWNFLGNTFLNNRDSRLKQFLLESF